MTLNLTIKTPFILLDYAISDYELETKSIWKLKEFHVSTAMLDRMITVLGLTRGYCKNRQLSYKGVPIIEDNSLTTSYAVTQGGRRVDL